MRVCAPVHDALLIEAPLEHLEDTVRDVQGQMADASRVVLGGFALRSEATLIPHPERYADVRGTQMWQTVWDIVHDIDQVSIRDTSPVHPRTPALSTS